MTTVLAHEKVNGKTDGKPCKITIFGKDDNDKLMEVKIDGHPVTLMTQLEFKERFEVTGKYVDFLDVDTSNLC